MVRLLLVLERLFLLAPRSGSRWLAAQRRHAGTHAAQRGRSGDHCILQLVLRKAQQRPQLGDALLRDLESVGDAIRHVPHRAAQLANV
ncbi:MAG TPA: hypothetical protein VIC55_07730, partial [Gemmatimonadaceae bacterium]